MTETEYTQLTDAVMKRIEHSLDAYEDDIEYELAAGGVLELEFENGSKIVVNRQSATQEIWVAAKSGGFHYRYAESQWQDTRTGEELFAALSRLCSEQSGSAIMLA